MQLLSDPVTIVRPRTAAPRRAARPAVPDAARAVLPASPRDRASRSEAVERAGDGPSHVTVLDFGVAGLPEYTVAGTLGFIAPEVAARRTSDAGERLLFRRRHRLRNADRRIDSHVCRARPGAGPREARSGRPVGELVKTLLSPDPAERRYTDANRLVDDLALAAGREVPPESADHRDSYLKAAPLIGRLAELDLLTDALESATGGARQRMARGRRERRRQVAPARRDPIPGAGARPAGPERDRRRESGAVRACSGRASPASPCSWM